MRSFVEVHEHLARRDVPHEIVHLSRPSTTAVRAAEALGVPLGLIVKSLLFLLDGRPALVLVPGDLTVDEHRLRAVTGCRLVGLAPPAEVERITGFKVGTVPPCGLAHDVPVIADAAVFEPPEVYCGGGTSAAMVRMGAADLRRVVPAQVARVAAAPGERADRHETECPGCGRPGAEGRP